MSFEHSAMKSFSLSSLQSEGAAPTRPDQLERPYHSLTKKRKEPSKELWRRSWGSAASGGSYGDDLWPHLQNDYDYIMDNQLIKTCMETNGELSKHNSLALSRSVPAQYQWSAKQFAEKFALLSHRMARAQEEIDSSPLYLSDKNLSMPIMSELLSIEAHRAEFLEQANAILDRKPELANEIKWRVDQLNIKWAKFRFPLSPEQPRKNGEIMEAADCPTKLRCIRLWLRDMEHRLPPPPSLAACSEPIDLLAQRLRKLQVLQHDVEDRRRVVSSVISACSRGEALEERWHRLLLRIIEWQCYLDASFSRIHNQVRFPTPVSDSDEEPAVKQPRLSRRSPRRSPRPAERRTTPVLRCSSSDSRQSCSEEEQDVLTYAWRSGSESETDLHFVRDIRFKMADVGNKMADERRVPSSCTGLIDKPTDQIVPIGDVVDGLDTPIKTPPTVIKRKKPVDSSKFNQTDRKSKNCGIFYFRHHDTDSDRQMVETDEKSQEESSEEEWTYVGGAKVANEDSTDIMTSSVEIQCELAMDDSKEIKPESPKPKMESITPDLLRVENTRCKDLEKLVLQAEELVQRQAQQQMAKAKKGRNFKPLMLDDEGKTVNHAKMSRIKEWLNQSTDGKSNNKGTESCDASGEYTTESEVDTSLTSDERNLHSSMDMSTSTCTVTPTHHSKVQLRKKRNGNNPRPWSVSCLSQISGLATSLAATPTRDVADITRTNMSISESALNTLATPQRVTPSTSNSKLRGSSTTVQGHVSSTNTMTEACTSCVETSDKLYWLRRKRPKLRRRGAEIRRDRLVKSLSFCGRLSPETEDKTERSTASDPATSRKNRFDTTSTSGNDSDDELNKQKLAMIANLRRSIEKTHISELGQENTIPEQNEAEVVAPSFKLGPAGGAVRPRMARSMDREKTILALSLGNPNELWDLSVDKDSDIDRSVNTGTEEHSSFSEQAWDFYQEKYNSENYSEAPDSDAARRLLEFGDDYRAFLDSQSDCCSSLSAQPDNDSPSTRRRKPSDISRERSLPRYKKPTRSSPVETPTRKPKKSMSSAERKKSLLDSLERSRNNTSIESNDGNRRRRPSENGKNSKRPEFDLVNFQALSRRRHNSNVTSDEINSSLEYNEVNNRPDILDSLHRRRRNDNESELQKVALSELRRRSTESADSGDDSSSPKKHSRRNHWSGDSDSDSEEVRTLIRRSSSQLEATEALMVKQDGSPDLLREYDYSDIETRCREHINMLNAALAGGSLSSAQQRDIRAVSARWSALRAAATRRGGARRYRREIAALREALDELCEADEAPQPHTRGQLHRRIEELKERLSRLLECKVSMLKLTVSIRRLLNDVETDDSGLATELSALLAAWDNAHQRTSNELISLEKAVSAWAEWESALRELQGALKGDLATLQSLREKGTAVTDQTEVATQIRQLAASLYDKKKSGSTCDSLSDSGISDGDSESAGSRARRLTALRSLAARLTAALAHNSPAQRAVAKRMEQTENEVRILQESCKALVELNIPELKIGEERDRSMIIAGNKTGSGDPDYTPRGGWLWRVLRSSLPIQLCLVALLLAAWLVERPRCCDALNSLAQTLTPQLRYVKGPPPV